MSAKPNCQGVCPLTARLEEWQCELLSDHGRLAELIDEHGSPLNLIAPAALGRNAAELRDAAARRGLDPGIHFARKANKSLALVEEAGRLGLGIDVASEQELDQTLGRGVDPASIVVTAAVKPRSLLELCARSGVTTVLDNHDELGLYSEIAAGCGARPRVGIRIAVSGAAAARPPTRFGFDPGIVAELGRNLDPALELGGLHFHVDGYDPRDRIAGLREAIRIVDRIGLDRMIDPFIDIGGGIPMSYLSSGEEWAAFVTAQNRAVAGEGEPFTYLGHGLGLHPGGGHLNMYPAYQEPIRGEWLTEILEAEGDSGGTSLAAGLLERGISLRCEPGRALLDGCGLTLARVEFRKASAAGEHLVGLAMNRTQVRSAADEFPVDPLLVRGPASPGEPFAGYLVGAYCVERELLLWRRLRFPQGVGVGDIVAFPNTAGYFMHILESSSHQMPLARNLVIDPRGGVSIDPIDAS